MKDSKPIGIRLPNSLWDLVKSANPDLTYSKIVKRALEEKYGFVTSNKIVNKKEDLSVEEKIDRLFEKKMVDLE